MPHPEWRPRALAAVRPSPDERARVERAAAALLARVEDALDERKLPGRALLVGSVAKDTFLHGHADLDVFVAFPPSTPRPELERRGLELGRAVFDDPVVAYAEHPYVRGAFEGFDGEVVPCYDLASPVGIQSAVDRTPFHTSYVKEKLDAAARDEVRLLKRFLVTIDAYGAEAAVEGVSGYLAELLVLHAGSFEGVLETLVAYDGRALTLGVEAARGFDGDVLVVVDPVDASRNVAAAVSAATLQRMRGAAARFRARPDVRFFTPPARAGMDGARARALLAERGTSLVALWFAPPPADIEDTRHARLRRAARTLARQLELEGCPIHGTAWDIGLASPAVLAFELDASALSSPRLHLGPRADAPTHAARFRARWEGAPDARSPVEVRDDGRLQVLRARDAATPAAVLRAALARTEGATTLAAAGPIDVRDGDDALRALDPALRERLLDRRPVWETWEDGP